MDEPARRRQISLEEGRLEVAFWGEPDPSKPAIVLLHEGLGSIGLWREFPARLAAATDCQVFAYSRFGYGRSDPAALPRPVDYMRTEAVSVLPRVLAEIGLGGRFVLLGHSDGATIATYYAALVNNRDLAGLILLAPHFFIEPSNLEAIAAIRADYEQTGLRTRLARHHDDPDNAFLGWADAWLDPRFGSCFDLSEGLAVIRAPVLILQGTQDPYGTAAQARMAERLCGGPVEVLLLSCGHAPHLEDEGRTVAAAHGFLARLPVSEHG